MDKNVLVWIDAAEACDAWGFVGTVHIGDQEAYRTIRRYNGPIEARDAVRELLERALGVLLVGQEWLAAEAEFGHPPRRGELGFGFQIDRAVGCRKPPEDGSGADG